MKNIEQIPTEENIEQTQRVAREQADIEGERKEVVVEDYPKAAEIAQILKDLDFPVDKNKIIQFVQQQPKEKAGREAILSTLRKIEDKQYKNVSEVTMAAGLVK